MVDPTYIEDFLLTYRTFLSSPMEVGRKLLEWFNVDSLRDKVPIADLPASRWLALCAETSSVIEVGSLGAES